jgi:hypothetical protein
VARQLLADRLVAQGLFPRRPNLQFRRLGHPANGRIPEPRRRDCC